MYQPLLFLLIAGYEKKRTKAALLLILSLDIHYQLLINSTSPYFTGNGRIITAAFAVCILLVLAAKVCIVNNSIVICAGAMVNLFAGK